MGYLTQREKAADWIASVENVNHGWGRTKGLASSIVNTTEALYVLTRAGHHRLPCVENGFQFIERTTLKALRKQSRTRYAFFALMAVALKREAFAEDFVDALVAWSLGARNPDGGWGHERNDGLSCLFPTAMFLLTLTELGRRDALETGETWIASAKQPNGWSLSQQQAQGTVATAMAVCALRRFRSADDKIFEHAKSDLLTVGTWSAAKEDLPGADWVHSGHMWGFAAVIALGFEPYIKPVAQGVRQLNDARCAEGWREPDGHLTVRGQYWTVMAFEALRDGFDPAVHVYRIDSARAHSLAPEPEFVWICPHTAWTVAIPARLYVLATLSTLALAVVFFLGVMRRIPAIPTQVDLAAAVVAFGTAFVLAKKRSALFPWWMKKPLFGVVALVELIHLVYGISVSEWWHKSWPGTK